MQELFGHSKIRLYTPEDWPKIWELFQLVAQKGDVFAYDESTSEETAKYLWVLPPSQAYVATIEEQFVGTYFIRPNQPGRGNHIANAGFMVHPQARNLKWGHRLLNHALVQAKKDGYTGMQFNFVVQSNHAAHRLWRSAEFQTIGIVPGAFRHAQLGLVDIAIMYRSLATISLTQEKAEGTEKAEKAENGAGTERAERAEILEGDLGSMKDGS